MRKVRTTTENVTGRAPNGTEMRFQRLDCGHYVWMRYPANLGEEIAAMAENVAGNPWPRRRVCPDCSGDVGYSERLAKRYRLPQQV